MLTRQAMQCTGRTSTCIFGDLAQSSAVVCSVVTASRCEVATHVATLVVGCEVSIGCESIGRLSLHWLKCPRDASQFEGTPCSVLWRHINNSLSPSLCERQCCCPCGPREHRICFWSLFPACTRDSILAVPWLMSVFTPALCTHPTCSTVFRLISHLLKGP